MKRKMIVLVGIMLIIIIVGIMVSNNINNNSKSIDKQEDAPIKIVTSFYPTYIAVQNIVNDSSSFNVTSLTSFGTGCLHDYQLTAQDMKTLAQADVFVMNGGGMESFMENVLESFPHLYIIDASQGIPMMDKEGHYHDEDEEGEEEGEEEDHDHEDFNSHVWLDPALYRQQLENIKTGFVEFINQNSNKKELVQTIEENVLSYLSKVHEIEEELDTINSVNKEGVVIFHDAFAYIANRIGLEIAHTIEMEADTALSAGEIAEVIDVIRTENIRVLFTEEQFGVSIAQRIESETDAKVFVIDSAVTGDDTKDSYLNAMRGNIKILKEIFQ